MAAPDDPVPKYGVFPGNGDNGGNDGSGGDDPNGLKPGRVKN